MIHISRKIVTALLLSALVALNLCGCFKSTGTDYEVLGQLEESPTPAPEAFDFTVTLRNLYPKCDVALIGAVESIDSNVATVIVVKSFDEEVIAVDSTFSFYLPENEIPDEEGIYLLFLTEQDEKYTAIVDENGLLSVRDQELYSKTGAKVSLTQVISELDKMKTYIYMPSYFYYISDLESLVESSSLVLTGQITDIQQMDSAMFYVREPGLEEITTQAATVFTISPIEYLKGSGQDSEIKVVLSDNMYRNTIVDSSFDQPVYSKENMPQIEKDNVYLFFLIQSPAGKHGEYMLFINPYQGYVPMYDDLMLAIPINAPFSYSQNIDDVKLEIEDILNGVYTYTQDGE